MTNELRYACQTYSWQMSLDRYRGRLDHMIATAAAAGFTGFEAELIMLGDQWSATRLRDLLQEHSVELAALVLVESWPARTESASEQADADLLIEALQHFRGAKLVLCPYPGADRDDLLVRQDNTLACMTAVARRAAEVGVSSTFHPNSPPGSLFRTATDYARLAEVLPPVINYTPDLGHIARGGMDPLAVVREWRDRIDHLHVKDIGHDGETWAPIGDGVVDVPGVLDFLAGTGYDGWVTFEDESPAAERDPDQAVARNGQYVADLRVP